MSKSTDSCVSIRPASTADAGLLHSLIMELAEYERLLPEVTARLGDFERWLFSPDAVAKAVIAELNGEPAGYAVYFPCYSTFSGRPYMYLEDIYVREKCRKRGVGEALMRAIAAETAQRGFDRMEWLVLDWNEPAIRFYQQLGARPAAPGWTRYGLSGKALAAAANRT